MARDRWAAGSKPVPLWLLGEARVPPGTDRDSWLARYEIDDMVLIRYLSWRHGGRKRTLGFTDSDLDEIATWRIEGEQ